MTDAALANRQEHLQALIKTARANDWSVVTQDNTMKLLDGSCLYALMSRNGHYENYLSGDDWHYVEVAIEAYGQTGLNRLNRQTVYYSVMSIKLPRKLPNVVFDSTRHQRRQFRVVFDPKQYIQLEGNFNKYFATYFGKGYAIDDLSFITPEVMEALITAQDYDIEIVRDSLLLFGPIAGDPAAQLNEMSQHIHLVRDKLLNNILTYRDERVPYDQGRRVVARAGMSLAGRQTSSWVVYLLLFIFIGWPYVLIALFFFIDRD